MVNVGSAMDSFHFRLNRRGLSQSGTGATAGPSSVRNRLPACDMAL
jgi:hypothetical protein